MSLSSHSFEASDSLKKILDQQGFQNGRTLKIGIRPENLRVGTKEDKNKLTGRVDVAEMLGSTTNIRSEERRVGKERG